MTSRILSTKSIAVLIFVLALSAITASARDEGSIKDLRKALIALSPDVDPREAELLSATAHTMSRQLAREYGVTLFPGFQNFLVNVGAREKGFCAHYTRDIGTRLKEFRFKTLVLHWGAAYAKLNDENNALVVTARGQPFQDGIVLDAWRRAGRLWWSPVKKDYDYEVRHGISLNRLSAEHSGVTAWKEDLQETAWLQDTGSTKSKTKRN
jgi:hypothetical protein